MDGRTGETCNVDWQVRRPYCDWSAWNRRTTEQTDGRARPVMWPLCNYNTAMSVHYYYYNNTAMSLRYYYYNVAAVVAAPSGTTTSAGWYYYNVAPVAARCWLLLLLLQSATITTTAVAYAVRDDISVNKERLTPAPTVTARSLRYNRRCRAETDVVVVAASSPPSAVSSPSVQTTPSRKSKKYVHPLQFFTNTAANLVRGMHVYWKYSLCP